MDDLEMPVECLEKLIHPGRAASRIVIAAGALAIRELAGRDLLPEPLRDVPVPNLLEILLSPISVGLVVIGARVKLSGDTDHAVEPRGSAKFARRLATGFTHLGAPSDREKDL
jgi:hypothetical protein